ncbi:transcription factor IIA, alpha/beta subunit [Lipomyces japonicus]|uniref:transcription factor IIA, alpha/beta subunit n=1 Tax=Lipomyces japonicus TaxID=56871 RepID=UPI0034CD0E71
MTNSLVGTIYRDIIEDVINSSRIDFEDSGVDEITLRELQSLWQERLSLTRVAQFPWDPEQPPPSPPLGSSQTGVAGNVKYEMASPPLYSAAPGGVPVGTQPVAFSNPAMAAMRAAQHIQQFAQEEKVPAEIADESIKGVMKRAGIDESLDDSNGGTAGGLLLPGGGRIAQVDGADDFPTEVIDKLLEARILRKISAESEKISDDYNKSSIRVRKSTKPQRVFEIVIPQTDGGLDSSDDDDEDEDDDDDINVGGGAPGTSRRHSHKHDDSDAINSDLDDSEDELNSENEEEDDSGMIMLCLYDKVQRTKNKWKCVLKDGVVNVNGKDYLFGKGNGEYEW